MKRFNSFLNIKRTFSNAVQSIAKESSGQRSYQRMSGWQIHSYGDSDEVQFSRNLKKPIIRSPRELLVQVNASSVNPLDTAMMSGYAATFLNAIRCNSGNIEFPLTLGRDFVGTIVQKGLSDNSHYKIGDKVWGVIPVQSQGSHAEFVSVDSCYVSKKPERLSDVEAAAVLYAGLTAYSGIFISAQLNGIFGMQTRSIQGNGHGKKVLVLGGSGGVGHIAVQILAAEGAEVFTTCNKDAVPLLEKLGSFNVVDYTTIEGDEILRRESPFDIVIDCAGKGADHAGSLEFKFKNYVTFTTPLLKNLDNNGLVCGGVNSLKNIVSQNLKSNCAVKWAFFIPSKNAILYLKNLVDSRKLAPIIDSTFSYNELPKAYEKVINGHLRGKVVIEH